MIDGHLTHSSSGFPSKNCIWTSNIYTLKRVPLKILFVSMRIHMMNHPSVADVPSRRIYELIEFVSVGDQTQWFVCAFDRYVQRCVLYISRSAFSKLDFFFLTFIVLFNEKWSPAMASERVIRNGKNILLQSHKIGSFHSNPTHACWKI